MTRHSLYPETAAEALAQWDREESVFTIEMGGLGPGYEQAIHIGVFELIRDYLDQPLPTTNAEREKFGDQTIKRIDALVGGYSGAQWGAAKNVAYNALRLGWRALLEEFKTKHPEQQDRIIQVSRFWPKAPELPA